jgi:hypothetical protein
MPFFEPFYFCFLVSICFSYFISIHIFWVMFWTMFCDLVCFVIGLLVSFCCFYMPISCCTGYPSFGWRFNSLKIFYFCLVDFHFLVFLNCNFLFCFASFPFFNKFLIKNTRIHGCLQINNNNLLTNKLLTQKSHSNHIFAQKWWPQIIFH